MTDREGESRSEGRTGPYFSKTKTSDFLLWKLIITQQSSTLRGWFFLFSFGVMFLKANSIYNVVADLFCCMKESRK